MKKSDLENILNGKISHIDFVNPHEPTDPKIEVIVLPMHVKTILLNYLSGLITAEHLNVWAEFICLRAGEYVSKNWEDDESSDFYEDMWYVVQKISTPEIDGEISPELIKEYLKELDKYFV